MKVDEILNIVSPRTLAQVSSLNYIHFVPGEARRFSDLQIFWPRGYGDGRVAAYGKACLVVLTLVRYIFTSRLVCNPVIVQYRTLISRTG